MIAAALVGIFAFLSIEGAFKVIYQQKKHLTEIENSIESDRKQMIVLEKYWSKVETLLDPEGIEENDFKITCKEKEKYYLLTLAKGKEKYCYFVTKHDR